MKNLSKLSLLVVFLSFFISSSVLAATSTSSLNTDATQPQKAVLLATVNIQSVKIISQEGNVFKISFSISNREILQAGVKYGVQLIKVDKTNQYIIDEYTYDESLTLSENTSINKEITYTAPAELNGNYFLRLVSKNSNGFPFAFSNTNAVTLISSVKGVSILTDSCTLSLNDKDVSKFITTGISLNSTDKLNLTCEGVNSSNTDIEVTPSFDTRYISAYGEVVIVPASTPITFNKLEKKSFSVLIPVASLKPQSYNTSMYLKSGDITSNKTFINYSINGTIATISNLSLDKESYVKGDTANVSIYGLFSNGPLIKNDKGDIAPPSDMTLTASITNGNNRKCSAVIENKISPISQLPQLNIPIKITRDCINPQVSVTVKDDKGVTLAEQTFSFNTGAVKNNNISKWLGISIVVLILIILVIYIYLKKKKEDKGDINGQNSGQNTPITPIASLFLFIALFSIFGLASAKVANADTVAVFGGGTVTYSLYTISGGMVSSTYKAGEKFQVITSTDSSFNPNSGIIVSINDSNAVPNLANSWIITAPSPSTSSDYNVNLTFRTKCNSGYRFNSSQKCKDPSNSITTWTPQYSQKIFAITDSEVVSKNTYDNRLNAAAEGDLFTLSMRGVSNGVVATSSGNDVIATYENRLKNYSPDLNHDAWLLLNPWADSYSYYTASGAYDGALYKLTINITNTTKIPTLPTLTVASQDSGLTATETAAAPYTVTVPTVTVTATNNTTQSKSTSNLIVPYSTGVTISWISTNATSCKEEKGRGGTGKTGFFVVPNMTSTTNFTVTCSN